MIKLFFLIVISFILETNLSLFINLNTNLFNSLFVLSSLIIINDFIKAKTKFYFLAIILGLIYDIIFTSKIGFNLITFLITAIFIKNIDYLFKTKINIIKYLNIIIFYRFIGYSILLLIGYFNFDIIFFLRSIYSSLIINIIYIIILKKIIV